jgi:acetyl-CoA carboxylase carboxyl transferase subunit alpha
MEAPNPGLAFESPIYELQARLDRLRQVGRADTEQHIRQLRQEIAETTRRIYDNLTPWQIVQVARHKDRPQTADYLSLVFDEYVQLHGDKLFGDDAALRTGFAKLDQFKVMVVGHQKGRTTKERTACYFGCAHPEGYRKAMAKMKGSRDLLYRYAGCLPGRGRRGTRSGSGHRGKHVRDVAVADSCHRCGDR